MKVLIKGEGLLAEYANEQLSKDYEVIRQQDTAAGIKDKPDLALVMEDTWNPSAHKEADELFRTAGIPWLRTFVSFGEGFNLFVFECGVYNSVELCHCPSCFIFNMTIDFFFG